MSNNTCEACAESSLSPYPSSIVDLKRGLKQYSDGGAWRTCPDIGDPYASREHYVRPGDILCFPRYNIHAFVTEATSDEITSTPLRINPRYETLFKLIWLDPSNVGAPPEYDFDYSFIRRSTLEEMGFLDSPFRVIKEDESHPTTWREMFSGGNTPDTNYETSAVPLGPRLPVRDLEFNREFSYKTINGLLNHPLVSHKHQGVHKGKAYFTAIRPDGKISAGLVLNSPNATQSFKRYKVEITRYAAHWEATSRIADENTATWMISNACKWAALEGYTLVRTLAGTAGNDGTIYQAANFSYDGIANGHGDYNRSGRENFDHDDTMLRYVRKISVDGDYAITGTPPRRIEARLEEGITANQSNMTFSEFTNEPKERTPDNFRFSREEVTDYKFHSDDNYPTFSPALQELVADTEAPINLEELKVARREKYPAAAFGAFVNRTLVAALLVEGDPQPSNSTATVTGYAARNTVWPDRTAQWLLVKARDWSKLNGYSEIQVPRDTFNHVPAVSPNIPKSVQIDTAKRDTFCSEFNRTPTSPSNAD